VTGFVVLTHDGQSRRVPFWVEVDHPKLAHEPARTLTHPGIYDATTVGGRDGVVRYRYPTGGDTEYSGPEVSYVVRVTKPVANFGVAVLSGHAVPHVVFEGDENHLVGFTGLPTALNPYLESFGEADWVLSKSREPSFIDCLVAGLGGVHCRMLDDELFFHEPRHEGRMP